MKHLLTILISIAVCSVGCDNADYPPSSFNIKRGQSKSDTKEWDAKVIDKFVLSDRYANSHYYVILNKTVGGYYEWGTSMSVYYSVEIGDSLHFKP